MKKIIGILIIGALPIFAYGMKPSEQKGLSKKAIHTRYKRKTKKHTPKSPHILFAYNPTQITYQVHLYNPTVIQHVPIAQQDSTSTATKQIPPPAYEDVFEAQDIYEPEWDDLVKNMEDIKQKINHIIHHETEKLSQLADALIKQAIENWDEITIEDILRQTSSEFIEPKTVHLALSWALNNLDTQDHRNAYQQDNLNVAHECLNWIKETQHYSLLQKRCRALGTRSPSTQAKILCKYHRKSTLMCPTCSLALRLRLFVEYSKQRAKKSYTHNNFVSRK